MGHAAAVLTTGKVKILIDPWFSGDFNFGVFFATPEIRPLSELEIAGLDAIHISHMHADHYCQRTLSRFPKSIPIFIARHRDEKFASSIRALGFENIFEIEPGQEGVHVGDLQLSVFLPARGEPYNSSLVVTHKGLSYLFGNDTRFSQDHYYLLSRFFKKFEAAFVGYADSYPFPLIYDFNECSSFHPANSNSDLLDFVREQSWRRIEGICEKLKPRWVFPYAAGFRFRHEDLLRYNKMFFPAAEVRQRSLFGAVPVLLEYGQILKFGELPNTDWEKHVETELIPLPKVDEGDVDVQFIANQAEALKDSYLKLLQKESRAWVSKISIEVCVEKENQSPFRLRFYFDGDRVHLVDNSADFEPDLTIRYSPAVLRRVLSGEWTYRNAHYSYRCRVDVKRVVSGQISVHSWENGTNKD